ncbi:zinc ribbon domain-containing protein [Methylacidimicrobium cyclopophantes]|nr:C4-type zinc ribbon domain-containing protein [Methylacidimicrobium cyclopophantes]
MGSPCHCDLSAVWEGGMHPDLPALLELQELDQKIARLRSELAQLPAAKRRLEAELEEARQKLQHAKHQEQAALLLRRQKEGEIEELRRRLTRYQAQQMQARKNEEYQALSHEIALVNAEVEREEDAVLLLLEKADLLKAEVKEEEEKAERAARTVQQKRKELGDRESRLTALLADAEGGREKKKADVNPGLLARYERLVQGHRENAVVPVVHGSCGGCHMKVTRQTLLRAEAGTELAFCENCGRILFVAA